MAFVEDSLLRKENSITHHDVAINEDEEMSLTLENFIILTWLRLINPNLPRLVKQRCGTELRTRTLASIKPAISQAMSSLLDELQSTEEVKGLLTTLIMRHTGHHRDSLHHHKHFAERINVGTTQETPNVVHSANKLDVHMTTF